MNDIIQSELIKNAPSVSYIFHTTVIDNVSSLDKAIDFTYFSSMTRLLRVTALALSFINKLKSRTRRLSPSQHQNSKLTLPICLSVGEISEAERLWIWYVQANSFQAEIELLLTGKHPKPIHVDQFRLKFYGNKILRCQGRIGNSSLPLCSNEPIILPSKHYLVSDVIISLSVNKSEKW